MRRTQPPALTGRRIFSYLFVIYLLLYEVYFRSLDAEKKCKYHIAICTLLLCIREDS